MISILDLLTVMVGGVVSLVSIGPSGQSSPPHAVSSDVAVHSVIVVAIGTPIEFMVGVVVLAIGIKLFPQIKTGYSLFLILSLSQIQLLLSIEDFLFSSVEKFMIIWIISKNLSYIYVFMYIKDKFFI